MSTNLSPTLRLVAVREFGVRLFPIESLRNCMLQWNLPAAVPIELQPRWRLLGSVVFVRLGMSPITKLWISGSLERYSNMEIDNIFRSTSKFIRSSSKRTHIKMEMNRIPKNYNLVSEKHLPQWEATWSVPRRLKTNQNRFVKLCEYFLLTKINNNYNVFFLLLFFRWGEKLKGVDKFQDNL